MTLSDILSRLEGVKGRDGKYMARCPNHGDKTPSLSVSLGDDGKTILHCFAGCSTEDVVWSMGLTMKDLFVEVTPATAFPVYESASVNGKTTKEAEYLYAGGQLKKLKYRRPDGSKFCSWLHNEGGKWEKGRKGIAPGLYQSQPDLPEVFFLVEGEKDVDSLKLAGYHAVSLPDGSQSKWEASYDYVFEGKNVLILPDNDAPGMKYAQMCAAKIHSVAAAVWVLDLKRAWPEIPEKGDISDMIACFGAEVAIQKVMDLDKIIPKWTPPKESEITGTEPKAGILVTAAQDLQDADLPPTVFLITGILPEGTSIISAASKIGKSWMVLDMGLSIAAGTPFMGHTAVKCGVLYLALEDSLSRLQDRMNKILAGSKAPAGFFFATEAPTLDNGLLDALDAHLQQYPETKLVIVDTLQKIRGRALPRESSYEQDYREMGTVKAYMDKKGVSVLFVHHNRKMKDEDDPFNMISGTNGIMGAADTIWAIIKGKRIDNEATLHITGRDVMQSNTVITFDKSTWKWKPVGAADLIAAQREKLAYDNNPIVKTIKELLKQNPEWKGTAKELLNKGKQICKRPIAVSAQALGYALRDLDVNLLDYDGIVHEKSKHGNAGNIHYFFYQSWTDEADQQEELPL